MKMKNWLRLLSMLIIIGAPSVGVKIKTAKLIKVDSFWIYQTEITNGMYAECYRSGACGQPCSKETNPHFWDPSYVNHPVVYVSWQAAQDFCHWVGGKLPTEAEWERAARGDSDSIYPWGDEPPSGELVNAANMIGTTRMVGMYPDGASPYGILDMAGNVREWVEDWYDEGRKVIKGGGFSDSYEHVSISDRLSHDPESAGYNRGFRCVIPIK